MSQQIEDKYIVRLPDGMRDRLKATASANKRSMNAEIVARLEASFSAPSHDHDAIKQALREVLEERDRSAAHSHFCFDPNVS